MKAVECEFEAEVLAAVLQSRWPERADAPLRAHVAECPICADVAAVAGALGCACEEERARASVPDSGRVWWLAQMRARREAAKAAGRPITAAQVIAVACAAGLLGACFGASSKWLQSGFENVGQLVAGFRVQTLLPSAVALIAEHSVVALAVAATLFLVPVAVYLALRD